MIELHNVSKSFGQYKVLKNINLTLPRYGLVIINGPSGCGKTTLLNIISTLLDFEGEVVFDGSNFSRLKESEKELIRNHKIGFVYQDYKLFEFDTVKRNILLSLDIASGDKPKKKLKRVDDLLKLVGLSNKSNELVMNLSGGEKQRVAIARALANSPNLILADEPTGNLDEFNTDRIMELLVKISSNSLVVMVSHDLALSKKYADQIIKMKDGEIVENIYQNKKREHNYLPVLTLNNKTKSRLLPFNFLYKHTLNSIKHRKWRTMFITLVTSIGLIGVGLASTLKSIISDSLYRSYSSILDDDRLILSNTDDVYTPDIVRSLDYEKVNEIYLENIEDIDYVGVYYANDFKSMFTTNYVYLDRQGTVKPINGLDISLINEFDLLNQSSDIIPQKVTELENDEFILSAPFSFVNEICYQLQIERTLDSFRKYLTNNELNFVFDVSNVNWSYSMNTTLTLKGFILSNNIRLYHSNHLWNEYILENKFLLPTTDYLNVNSSHPWDLKKGYFFQFKQNRDAFIKEHRFDFKSHNYDFEILDNKYYPNLYKNIETSECPRVLAISRSKKDFLPSFIGPFCKESSKYVKSITYGSSFGYAIYDKSLMIGFSKSSFLSSEEQNIEDVIDLLSYIKYEDSQNISLPNGTLEGHFSKSNISGFVFEPYYQLISGTRPTRYEDIVISTALAEKLSISNPINKILYFTFPVSEVLLPSGYLVRDFKTVSLKIVGISNSSKLALHHDESWSILFFQCMLGVSTLELNVENLAIQIDRNHENEVVKQLNRAFPQYEVFTPLKDVRKSVDEICNYIEIILLIVSITSVLIASLILLICNHLHFLEAKKDIGLVRCLGSKKSESMKFIFFHSFIMTSISFLLSLIELFFISFFLSKVLADSLNIGAVFIFNPMSVIYMLLVDILVSLISCLLISDKISKLQPLECLS